MSIEENVTNRVKDIIQERGIQQKHICEKTGISQVKLSQCFNGKRKKQILFRGRLRVRFPGRRPRNKICFLRFLFRSF